MAKRTSKKRTSKRSSRRSKRSRFHVVMGGKRVGSAGTLAAAKRLARRMRKTVWIDRGKDSWEV